MSRAIVLCLALAACDGGHMMMQGGEQTFTLRFKAMVGAEDFAVDKTFAGVGAQATFFTPTDLRFYIHDVKLIHHPGQEEALALEQDGKWQYQNIALLDFEDKGTAEMSATVTGKAPAGTYMGVHFKVGVPFELNHKDIGSAPSPLNLSTMYWAWNGGYKFIRLEGKSATLPFLQLHLGSTGCMGGNNVSACTRPNRPDVEVTGLDPATGTIVFDVAKLFADTNLNQNQAGTPAGCMGDASDGDCAGMFKNLGLKLAEGMPDASAPQTAFRAP